jgi:integrase
MDFLKEFWDYDNSPYIREKQAHGHRTSRSHCYNSTNRLKRWEEAFPDIELAKLTKADIRAFTLSLREAGLSTASVNKIAMAGSTALGWAHETGMIAVNPFDGTMRFSEEHEKRGILTDEETARLFTEGVWPIESARVAALLAVTTGLRQGECHAVQVGDIGADTLEVWTFSDFDGRKKPKNGENRTVPLLPQVRDELLRLAKKNPFSQGSGAYVLFSAYPDKPVRTESVMDGLSQALESIGISREERMERHVDFHSFRHFYATSMAGLVASNKVRSVTGHKSAAIFQVYSEHSRKADRDEVQVAAESAFAAFLAPAMPERKRSKVG